MKKFLVLTLLAAAFLFSGCGSDKSTQVPMLPDDAPPLAPTGLACRVDNSLIAVLTWARNVEPDLAGYRVYVYDPDPRRNGSYVLQNPDELLTEPRWTSPIQYDQVLWVRLTAVDAAGNESGECGPNKITSEPPPSPPAEPPPTIKPPQVTEEPHGGSDGATGDGPPTPPGTGSDGGHGETTDGSGTNRNG